MGARLYDWSYSESDDIIYCAHSDSRAYTYDESVEYVIIIMTFNSSIFNGAPFRSIVNFPRTSPSSMNFFQGDFLAFENARTLFFSSLLYLSEGD